ncbi:hypothetical protein PF010_g23722 [Phytophthora fragariae]|uniref:Uncharacterized protein n=1 Tax=Phytophthora fragariae TaxID=53985 RepID=A0A6A3JIF4_9STRA|nr:hypothetical protein PF011_g16553 [Phytophthora fragariae]KAE9076896.1 hypothetical protein PF010_g23722 [Phytophthora fragariae]KAE9077838.1 hypothetical protein PF007_g24096 [Phytophthora fragariae]KAE9098278.1 hypothetical protein PF006_g23388 [Phytophthora fragariae]KAE9189190.1 hypothetical protein PF002_g25115 [Phytophthora fragariae]
MTATPPDDLQQRNLHKTAQMNPSEAVQARAQA